jgi:hypothetical protein
MIQVPDEIKELLKQGSVRKNFRVKFPNGDHADLTNKDIISESVSFTESLCSQDELKFGLCEANTISFETFNVGNIKGKTIDCQIEIDCTSLDASFIEDNCTTPDDLDYPVYSIAYGRFEVDSCVRDSGNLQRRKVDAFSIDYYSWGDFENSPLYEQITKTKWPTQVPFYFPLPIKDFIENPPEPTTLVPLSTDYSSQIYSNFHIDGTSTNISVSVYGYKFTFTSGPSSHMSCDEQYCQGIAVRLINRDAILSRYDAELPNVRQQIYSQLIAADVNTNTAYNIAEEVLSLLREFPGAIYYNIGEYWNYTNSDASDYPVNAQYEIYSMRKPGINTAIRVREVEKYDSGEYNNNSNFTFIAPTIVEVTLNGTTEYYHVLPNTFNAVIKYDKSSTYLHHHGTAVSGIYNDGPGWYVDDARYKSDIANIVIPRDKSIQVSRRRNDGTIFSATNYTTNPDDNNWILNARLYKEAECELKGVFGRIDRQTNLFETVDINRYLGVYPADDLFPSNDLYPNGGNGEGVQLYDMSMYSKAWYDDLPTKKYSAVTCTYHNYDNEELVETYTIVDTSYGSIFNPDNYQVYDLSDNEIIKNSQLSQSQIQNILQTLAGNIRYVQYMPADIDCIGLPYVESGDVADVTTSDGAFETIILRRTLSGIQALSDNIESKG